VDEFGRGRRQAGPVREVFAQPRDGASLRQCVV